MAMWYDFIPGGKALIKQDTPPSWRTWDGVCVAPHTVCHIVESGGQLLVVTIPGTALENARLRLDPRAVVPHYAAGDRLRLRDITDEQRSNWSLEFREFIAARGEDHPFTAALPSGETGVTVDDPIYVGVRCAIDLHLTVPVIAIAPGGPCSCPLDVLMREGCKCGGS